MAIIQYSGLVNEIRGALNGSTLNKSKTIMTVSNKGVPSRSITEEQSVSRARFQRIQTAWKNLTPAQMADWSLLAENVPNINRFGEEVVLSGYNKYLEATINADVAQTFISYPIDTGPLQPVTFEDIVLSSIELVTYLDGSRAFLIRFSLIGASFATRFFVCDISKPLSRGVTSFSGSFRLMGSTQVSGTGQNILITSRDLPTSWSYQDGDRVAVRIYSMILGRGLVNYERIWLRDIGLVPLITSLTATPSSGSQPYVYRISFANKNIIDGVVYDFEFRTQTATGLCPVGLLTNPTNPTITPIMLQDEEFTSASNVPAGVCRTIEGRIVRVSDGAIVSVMQAFISNI